MLIYQPTHIKLPRGNNAPIHFDVICRHYERPFEIICIRITFLKSQRKLEMLSIVGSLKSQIHLRPRENAKFLFDRLQNPLSQYVGQCIYFPGTPKRRKKNHDRPQKPPPDTLGDSLLSSENLLSDHAPPTHHHDSHQQQCPRQLEFSFHPWVLTSSLHQMHLLEKTQETLAALPSSSITKKLQPMRGSPLTGWSLTLLRYLTISYSAASALALATEVAISVNFSSAAFSSSNVACSSSRASSCPMLSAQVQRQPYEAIS